MEGFRHGESMNSFTALDLQIGSAWKGRSPNMVALDFFRSVRNTQKKKRVPKNIGATYVTFILVPQGTIL